MKTITKSKIAITSVCFILGTMLSIQFRSIDEVDTNIISTQRSKQIAIEYKKLKTENNKIKKEMNKLERKVSQYEKDGSNKDPLLENLYEDIEKYKVLSGYKDVIGSGVVIEIDNPPADIQIGEGENVMVDHYTFLLEIISLLNAVDTEAISINNQRYTAFTEIVPAGNLLEINGTSFATPIVINAIGNSEDMENALRIKGGIIWLMEEAYNLRVNIYQKSDIMIPKYEKVKNFKHANPIEEGLSNP